MGCTKLINLVNSYLVDLGCSKFEMNDIAKILSIKLANANVVQANKSDKSSHQSHIAITGKAIDFFYSKDELAETNETDISLIDALISKRNIEKLKNEDSVLSEIDRKFVEGKVSIGKRTQNQVQLSKSKSDNCDIFNNLRNALRERDLLVMVKLVDCEEVYFLGIPEKYYLEHCEDYDKVFNASTFFSLEKIASEQGGISAEQNHNMILDVYSEKNTDGNGNCYLSGCTLAMYMDSIPVEYRDNVIQRGIVKNVYLDRIVDTIISQGNIPAITLIGEEVEVLEAGKKIKLKKYRILDGLQRTYRIHEVWKSLKLFDEIGNKEELKTMSKMKIARSFSDKLREKECDVSVLLAIIDEYKRNGNIDRFKRYFYESIQWFEIWEELSPIQETEKMLILNAGHKQMDIRHQLELLFLNVLPRLNEICTQNGGKGIKRNKEISDTLYSKNRIKGEFYFSHIISAIISYYQKKPITTNTALVNQVQEDKDNLENYFSYSKLESYMRFLVDFDDKLVYKFGDIGVKWIARETTLVALFAAIALYDEKHSDVSGFDKLINKVKCLNLSEFESAKQINVEISKVNVGNITKKAVKNAVLELLEDKTECIDWNNYFGGKEDAED